MVAHHDADDDRARAFPVMVGMFPRNINALCERRSRNRLRMARRITYRPAVVQGQAQPSPDGDPQRGVEPAGPRIFDTSEMWPKTISALA